MRRFTPKIVAPPHSNLPFEVVMVESFDGEMVLHSDHAAEITLVEWQRDDNRRMLDKALKYNALLRAECEAWRAWSHNRFDGRTMYHGDQFQQIRDARAATDAAGVLKGVER